MLYLPLFPFLLLSPSRVRSDLIGLHLGLLAMSRVSPISRASFNFLM